MKKCFNNPKWSEYQQDFECVNRISKEMANPTKKVIKEAVLSMLIWAVSFAVIWFVLLPIC